MKVLDDTDLYQTNREVWYPQKNKQKTEIVRNIEKQLSVCMT